MLAGLGIHLPMRVGGHLRAFWETYPGLCGPLFLALRILDRGNFDRCEGLTQVL